MERLFVDVDETLVFHNGCCEAPQVLSTIHNIWDDEFNHPLLRNQRLADAIIKWQKDNDERKVFVWSANGDAWAATAATAFFNGIIPIENTGGKDKLFSTVTSSDLAIDDREAQWYLKPFERVFKPQEFIKYME